MQLIHLDYCVICHFSRLYTSLYEEDALLNYVDEYWFSGIYHTAYVVITKQISTFEHTHTHGGCIHTGLYTTGKRWECRSVYAIDKWVSDGTWVRLDGKGKKMVQKAQYPWATGSRRKEIRKEGASYNLGGNIPGDGTWYNKMRCSPWHHLHSNPKRRAPDNQRGRKLSHRAGREAIAQANKHVAVECALCGVVMWSNATHTHTDIYTSSDQTWK